MGLKQIGFIDWFKGKFPEAVRVVPRREGARFDSVFIDVNCILHPAMMGAKDEATFVKKLFAILHELLFQFIPTRICYLAVDGPAPLAKIVTQKSRRAAKVNDIVCFLMSEPPRLYRPSDQRSSFHMTGLETIHGNELASNHPRLSFHDSHRALSQLLCRSLHAAKCQTRWASNTQVCDRSQQQPRRRRGTVLT